MFRSAVTLLLGATMSLVASAGEVSRSFSVTLNLLPGAGQCVGSSLSNGLAGSVQVRCTTNQYVLLSLNNRSEVVAARSREVEAPPSSIQFIMNSGIRVEPGASFSVASSLNAASVGGLVANVQVFPGVLNQDDSMEMLVTF